MAFKPKQKRKIAPSIIKRRFSAKRRSRIVSEARNIKYDLDYDQDDVFWKNHFLYINGLMQDDFRTEG